jgi:hypothetical protein
MPDNDTRSINGRGAVRLENDRICVFERDGVYQARIRTEANRYLWRSLRTRNHFQAISAARKLFHSIEFRQQSQPIRNTGISVCNGSMLQFTIRRYCLQSSNVFDR